MARCKPNAAHSPKHTGNNNNNNNNNATNNSHYNNSNNNNTTPRITRINYNNRKSTENNEIKTKHKKKSECDGGDSVDKEDRENRGEGRYDF